MVLKFHHFLQGIEWICWILKIFQKVYSKMCQKLTKNNALYGRFHSTIKSSKSDLQFPFIINFQTFVSLIQMFLDIFEDNRFGAGDDRTLNILKDAIFFMIFQFFGMEFFLTSIFWINTEMSGEHGCNHCKSWLQISNMTIRTVVI